MDFAKLEDQVARRMSTFLSLLERFRRWHCRRTGHRPGPVWYNVGGLEPDMRCRGCGENMG